MWIKNFIRGFAEATEDFFDLFALGRLAFELLIAVIIVCFLFFIIRVI